MLGMTNKSRDQVGAFAELVLSDGPLAFKYLIEIIKEIKSFGVSSMAAHMVMILNKRFPNECSLTKIFDTLLSALNSGAKTSRNDCFESQSYYMTLCRLLVSKKEWKRDQQRLLAAVRRAFMKDIVDLKYYGSWQPFLKEFGFSCISEVDKELETRTSAVESGRSSWWCRTMSVNTNRLSSRYSKEDQKCCNLHCDELQSLLDPFTVECIDCHEAMYCSELCRYEDLRAHHKSCQPSKQEEKSAIQKEKPKSLDTKSLCENCGDTLHEGDQVRLCNGCGKVRFCSVFCAEYSMKKGVHGRKCIVGPRRYCFFDYSSYDDFEHPGRCIICHETFEPKQQMVVADSCLYKKRYCMCSRCHNNLELLPKTQKKHCAFCRLALVERT